MSDAPELVSVPDYERAAARRLSTRADAYISGGAADELSLRDNPRSWDRWALVPRVLTGTVEPSLEVTLLGRARPHPLLIAPTAFARLTDPDGEEAIARGAALTGTTYCVPTLAGVAPDALARAVPDCARWLQLYVFADRDVTRDAIATAARSGYEALVVTADRPVVGVRDRERRHDVRRGTAAAPDPAGGLGGATPRDFSRLIDPSLSWADLERIVADSPLPVLLKGVLRPDDARRAVDHGCAGVIVSNHGGRQLDSVLAAPEALAPIVDAVGDRCDVLVDGGVRRGTDVLKALALGARATLIGRPALWGLTVAGGDGVRAVIALLLAELRVALALAGAPAAAAVDRDLVVPAPWAWR